MDKPTVSVIMATYNMGGYVAKSLESVLSQTRRDFEIVVIDDGSTDDTKVRLAPYMDHPQVKYIYQENAGQAAALNKGISLASGEYIAFCDADDYWHSKKLEIQMPQIMSHPDAGVIYSQSSLMDEHDKAIERSGEQTGYSGKITEELFISNFIPFGTAIVRKQCLNECGGFDPILRWGQDWNLWLSISMKWQFLFVAEPTYTYRLWHGQLTKNFRALYKNAFFIMDRFLTNHPDAITKSTLRRAHASTYCNRGLTIFSVEKKLGEALIDITRAILADPLYSKPWKSAVKMLRKGISPRRLLPEE